MVFCSWGAIGCLPVMANRGPRCQRGSGSLATVKLNDRDRNLVLASDINSGLWILRPIGLGNF